MLTGAADSRQPCSLTLKTQRAAYSVSYAFGNDKQINMARVRLGLARSKRIFHANPRGGLAFFQPRQKFRIGSIIRGKRLETIQDSEVLSPAALCWGWSLHASHSKCWQGLGFGVWDSHCTNNVFTTLDLDCGSEN